MTLDDDDDDDDDYDDSVVRVEMGQTEHTLGGVALRPVTNTAT